MESRFKVVSAYTLEARNLFVLSGEMLEGRIMSGMSAVLGDDDPPLFHDRVHNVEFFEDPRSSATRR